MKTTSHPTSHILIKASTNSDWDKCNFAIIDCTNEWKQQLKHYLEKVKLFVNDDSFISLEYRDTSVEFYRYDEDEDNIEYLLQGKEWVFVSLDNTDEEVLLAPESRLNRYHISISKYGTAVFSAYGKYSGEEYFTSEFSIASILNYNPNTVKIIQSH